MRAQVKTLKTIFSLMMVAAVSANNIYATSPVKPEKAEEINPYLSAHLDKPDGLFLEVGLLYEQMYFSNNKAATYLDDLNGSGPNVSPPIVGSSYDVVSFDFGLDPGLRVEAARYFGYNDWKISAAFEWIHSKPTINKDVRGDEYLLPVISLPTSNEDNRSLVANFNVNYYLLDVTCYRGAFESDKLKIRPNAGIKAAWFNTRSGRTFRDPTSGAAVDHYERVVSKSWAVGPMLGFDVKYPIFDGMNIYCDNNVSILMGHQYTNSSFWDNLSSVWMGLSTTTGSYVDKGFYFTPTVRTSLGLQFSTLFMRNKVESVLKIGFDGRYYFNQYPSVKPQNTTNIEILKIKSGSWGMMGLVVTLGTYF